MKKPLITRCAWAEGDPLYQKYHDEEWGVPLHDDRMLFEFLILDGMQAGLSWLTILKKRENFRNAFDRFNPDKIARYGPEKIKQLLSNKGIIRNRLKIEAAVKNAGAFLRIQEEAGSFDTYIWKFVGYRTIQNSFRDISEIPAKTPESEVMSKDLVKRGFTFVGPTICYAFMQAAGLVNDHVIECFRHQELLS
ncbi:MAG: DNA-3-methyladenine glycosylase I [Candidatus Aminicenantes bacterium]|nr:DNA-3-methyladenine glycosylase I [Candidatus Aminicenantes bacterium]